MEMSESPKNEKELFDKAFGFGVDNDPIHIITSTGTRGPLLQRILLRDTASIKPEDFRAILAALAFCSERVNQLVEADVEDTNGYNVILTSYKREIDYALEHVKLSAQQLVNKYI